uniref:Uncharacterized protein n=1 Tax=Kalanchoe fedtschenkoi TaxID=63787 RepID=A0A7N0TT21_KALFE
MYWGIAKFDKGLAIQMTEDVDPVAMVKEENSAAKAKGGSSGGVVARLDVTEAIVGSDQTGDDRVVGGRLEFTEALARWS